ncbi:branched-chain amino acid transport system II carrier protein [Salinicoccus sp. HZC-1]|uniref:branched-chain amino acid transport system II carrier protein n=1 Tax=Salinicoccus sp. HZC-1 TaxID=3385497 RepID=UPI00398AA385
MNRLVLISGLMLFSLFFGAGNLIFPPMLGHLAGEKMWVAMTGFTVTGILLPFITVIVVAYYDEGVERIGKPVHPLFGLIFAILIYMSIGAFYGIPRAANVAYEIGTGNLLPVHNSITLIIFSIIFFIVVYIAALNPTKIVNNIGKLLTPLLLIGIALLSIYAIFRPEAPLQASEGKYSGTPFISGVLEGYFTMDLIAALAFSIVIVNGFKYAGITDKSKIIFSVIKAGILSSGLLAIVYFSLAYIGGTTSRNGYQDGTDILTYNSLRIFGNFGDLLFSSIVVLACLTTCTGLVNACAEFAFRQYNRISYKIYVTIFTAVGFFFTTLGLETILSLALPLLTFLYPLSIVLVLVSLINIFIGFELKYAYILPVIVTLSISIMEIIYTNGLLNSDSISAVYLAIPLSRDGLGWLLPFVILTLIGLFIDHRGKRDALETKKQTK